MTDVNSVPLETRRQLWIEALRSGEYEQGAQRLCTRQPNGKEFHCCLGVACEVYIRNGGKLNKNQTEIGAVRFGCAHLYLPEEVKEWLGMATDAGSFGDGSDKCALSYLNDEGTSFNEIANIIEASPEGLFV